MEVEDPLIKRWRELGYCPVIELAKDMGKRYGHNLKFLLCENEKSVKV